MPLPESLHLEKADFPPGTFVPSAKLASDGLLEVRAVIFAPNIEMFVVDRAADCVRIYETRTGRHLRNLNPQSDQLDRPIHLLLSPDGRYLLIGSGGKDSILRHDLRQGSTIVFVEPKSAGLKVRQEWHLVTMVSSTLLVAIQRKSCASVESMADHAASLSSTTCPITRSF
jgi:hypothetical protein